MRNVRSILRARDVLRIGNFENVLGKEVNKGPKGHHSTQISDNGLDGGKKCGEFLFIEHSIGTDAAANVERVGLHLLDCIGNVGLVQAAGKEEGDRHSFANVTADIPVVCSSGAPQLFDGKTRVARIEENRMNIRRDSDSFINRMLAKDVNDLHDRDAGQFITELPVRLKGNRIDQLKSVDTCPPLLGDDRGSILFAR